MGFKGIREKCKLIRCMKGSIRILARARDLYLQNISGNGGGVQVFSGSAGISCPAPQLGSLSRNTSSVSSSTNSRRSTSSGGYSRQSIRRAPVAHVPRSHSVPFGRIDEDKCCHFGVDNEPEATYPKSKSCAVTRRSIDVY